MRLKWQPFDFVTGDTIVLRVNVAGAPVSALVDTGSPISFLDASVAREIGIFPNRHETIAGIGGRETIPLAENVELSIGADQRRLSRVALTELQTMSSGLGRSVGMVLGTDALSGYSIALDFDQSQIGLAERGSFASDEHWVAVRLSRSASGELLIAARVNGGPGVPFILDLGSSAAVILNTRYVQQWSLLDGVDHSTALIGGIGGLSIAQAFIAKEVSVGRLRVDNLPSLAVEQWLAPTAVGSLGLPFLAQFDVVIDLADEMLWLRPAKRPSPMLKDRSGLGVTFHSNQLRVVHIAPRSPAEAQGWKLNERITAIDGLAVDDRYTHTNLWRWRFSPSGTSVTLTDQSGQRRRLTLRDYY